MYEEWDKWYKKSVCGRWRGNVWGGPTLKDNLVLYVLPPKFYGRFILIVICYGIVLVDVGDENQ